MEGKDKHGSERLCFVETTVGKMRAGIEEIARSEGISSSGYSS